MIRRVALVITAVTGLMVAATSAARADPVADQPRVGGTRISPSGTLAPRLSSADGAMEYWDVTAWLDSGERFFARFLVTNQGPGDRTAAALGHLVLANGDVLPFKWGRRDGGWTLGADGRRLEIGKATLDFSGSTIVVAVDSRKNGIEMRLEIERTGSPELIEDSSTPYSFEVAMPAVARATITARGAGDAHEAVGSGAVAHTWTARAESELIRRRDEILARQGERSFYLTILTLPDGMRHAVWLERHQGSAKSGTGNMLTFGAATTAGSDARYPVATEWTVDAGDLRYAATLGRELLRMNPLEIVPQPFRFLLSLGGEPLRVWADVTIQRTPHQLPDTQGPDLTPLTTELRGIAVSTFAGAQ